MCYSFGVDSTSSNKAPNFLEVLLCPFPRCFTTWEAFFTKDFSSDPGLEQRFLLRRTCPSNTRNCQKLLMLYFQEHSFPWQGQPGFLSRDFYDPNLESDSADWFVMGLNGPAEMLPLSRDTRCTMLFSLTVARIPAPSPKPQNMPCTSRAPRGRRYHNL